MDVEPQENKEEEPQQTQEGEGLARDEPAENKEEEVPAFVEKPKEYVPFLEEHYRDRQPHPEFQAMKELEDLALALQKENLKVIVVCAGILYGKGEILLHKFLKVNKGRFFI